ncbi:MAG: hypothetical protein WCL11_28510 [Verrucomicrobiota bacterium]
MKLSFPTALAAITLSAFGQGTFIYDQQSATSRAISADAPFQHEQPFGQAFTPTLAEVGFVQFELNDNPFTQIGTTVYVNLWADSLATGTLLGSTAPVFIPDGFRYGITNFFFATPVPVTPGTTYYLQPVVQSGDDFYGIIDGHFNYANGTWFAYGQPVLDGRVLWFREGTYVPEPSSALLLALAAATLCAPRFRRLRRIVGCR